MFNINEKYHSLRNSMIKEFGWCCKHCGSVERLEFAHIKPTKLNGSGRGSMNRILDVINNKDCYVLLCRECHIKMDNSMGDSDWVHSFIS